MYVSAPTIIAACDCTAVLIYPDPLEFKYALAFITDLEVPP
jgi:hypothetical protein